MALEGFSKSEKKTLRELAGQAYRAELNAELMSLFEAFQAWHKEELDPFELSDKIHDFHQGAARELYNRYHERWADMTVSRALALGLLDDEGLSEALREKLTPKRDFFEHEA